VGSLDASIKRWRKNKDGFSSRDKGTCCCDCGCCCYC
jgi:hypothetical protein